MSKKLSAVTCLIYALITASLGLCIFLLPTNDFSCKENRMLAVLPSFSADSIASGELRDGISEFCPDRFPLRDFFITLNACSQLALGRLECGGVIPSKNGYLIKRTDYTDLQALKSNLQSISGLSSTLRTMKKSFAFFAVPSPQELLSSFCPAPLPTEGSKKASALAKEHGALSNASFLEEKARQGEYVFYRTDHHWTTLGAYYAYAALGEQLGYTPAKLSDFTQELLSSDFLGSVYNAAPLPFVKPDAIIAYRYENDTDILVTDMGTGEISSLYDTEKLNSSSKYDVFVGGNKGHIKLDAKKGKYLVILKDSYANSLIPFLSRHFDLHVVDPRYIKGSALELVTELCRNENCVGLLSLFSTDTLTGNCGLF